MHTYTLSSCYSAKLFWGVLKSKAHPQQHCDMLKNSIQNRNSPPQQQLFLFFTEVNIYLRTKEEKTAIYGRVVFFLKEREGTQVMRTAARSPPQQGPLLPGSNTQHYKETDVEKKGILLLSEEGASRN